MSNGDNGNQDGAGIEMERPIDTEKVDALVTMFNTMAASIVRNKLCEFTAAEFYSAVLTFGYQTLVSMVATAETRESFEARRREAVARFHESATRIAHMDWADIESKRLLDEMETDGRTH